MSPSFQLGGACVGSVPGNTLWYLHNTVRNNVLYFSSMLGKCGIVPFGRSPSPYKISYKNKTGLPDVIRFFIICNIRSLDGSIWKFIPYQHNIGQ